MHEKGEKNHPFLLQCSSGVSWALKKVKETSGLEIGEKQEVAQRIRGKKQCSLGEDWPCDGESVVERNCRGSFLAEG